MRGQDFVGTCQTTVPLPRRGCGCDIARATVHAFSIRPWTSHAHHPPCCSPCSTPWSYELSTPRPKFSTSRNPSATSCPTSSTPCTTSPACLASARMHRERAHAPTHLVTGEACDVVRRVLDALDPAIQRVVHRVVEPLHVALGTAHLPTSDVSPRMPCPMNFTTHLLAGPVRRVVAPVAHYVLMQVLSVVEDERGDGERYNVRDTARESSPCLPIHRSALVRVYFTASVPSMLVSMWDTIQPYIMHTTHTYVTTDMLASQQCRCLLRIALTLAHLPRALPPPSSAPTSHPTPINQSTIHNTHYDSRRTIE